MRQVLISLVLVLFLSARSHAEEPIVATLPGKPAAAQAASDSLGDYGAIIAQAASSTQSPQGVAPAPVEVKQVPPPSVVSTPGGAPALNPSSAHAPVVAAPVQQPQPEPAPAPATQIARDEIVIPPPVVHALAPAAESGDSIGENYAGKAAEAPAQVAPTAKVPAPDKARGVSLLPARPAAKEISFNNARAAEVVLRFAREYRTAIVFLGDGSTPVTGWTMRTDSLLEMLQAFFPAPDWTISKQGESYIVSERTQLSFPKISLAEINPSLEPKK